MRNIIKLAGAAILSVLLVGCGQQVEVPPAHIGKIMGKDGYQENVIPTSKFRLPACWTYCDRLVLLNVADNSYTESLKIFIPEDKLNLGVAIRATLGVNPKRTQELFSSVPPVEKGSQLSVIEGSKVYTTYAQQVVLAETREYLSQFSISEIASSNEKINAELGARLSKVLEQRTPFTVRHIGITDIRYPQIITDAQEAAAERREAIQQEEAQLNISKVTLERKLQEARLTRAIEKEKAETEAIAQKTLAESVDSRVLELRKLEIQRIMAEKWDGKLPVTSLGDSVPMINLGK